jgi:CheY-like chemotaxis protein
MLVIFCEECGGKNMVDQETLEHLEVKAIDCQICNSHISMETVISYSGSEKSADTKDLRLLFIDDDPVFLELMNAAITKEYMVSLAQTGEKGLRLAAELKPDMIFLDINMPEMDGYEICTKLKNNEQLRHIPVIFITANTAVNDEWKGLNLGAVDYMNKPIEPQIFHARVSVHIRIQKLLNEHKKEAQKSLEFAEKLKENALLLEQKQEIHHFALLALKDGLDEVNQMVTLLDSNGKIKWANKKCQEALALPLESMLGHSCSNFFSDTDEECAVCFEPSLKKDNRYQSIEHFSSKLQTLVSHKHIPLFNDDGELLSQIHIATPHDTMPEEQKQANEHLEEFVNKPLADMGHLVATLTTVSHSVTNFETENEQLAKYSDYVSNSLTKLTEILDELKPHTSA